MNATTHHLSLPLEISALAVKVASMIVAHVSDLHLGKKSPGDANGSQRLLSFRQALKTIAGHKPDVLLIAGDTFDSPHVDPAIIEETARCLEEIGNIPVVIIPGNHDPADENRLWLTFRKGLISSVYLVLEPGIIPVENDLLVEAYPCPSRFSPAPPWEKRLAKSSGLDRLARVVLAHGTLQGGPVPEDEGDAYPFTQDEVDSLGADYVALGHFHGVYPQWNGAAEIERSVCYSGTHEPDQFGGEAGYAILAEVNKGRPTRLRRLKVGRRDWRLLEIRGPADIKQIEELRQEIAAGEPNRFVIRLKISSRARLSATEMEELFRLEGALNALGANVDRRGTAKAPVDRLNIDLAELPSGAVKEALLSFQAELSKSDESCREVLAAALQLGCEKLKDAAES
jgi:DNA repair exonuclease SbcCD nuclease subunit